MWLLAACVGRFCCHCGSRLPVWGEDCGFLWVLYSGDLPGFVSFLWGWYNIPFRVDTVFC